MPKIIAHALTGAMVIATIHPKAGIKNRRPLLVGAALALSPDLDFALEWVFGIPEIHRGFTHSLIFSIIVGCMISLLSDARHQRESVAFSLAYFSHALLDSMLSTAGGVKLFWPFSDKYYRFGLTGVFELPVGSDLSGVLNWAWIEALVFIPLFGAILSIKHLTVSFGGKD